MLSQHLSRLIRKNFREHVINKLLFEEAEISLSLTGSLFQQVFRYWGGKDLCARRDIASADSLPIHFSVLQEHVFPNNAQT